MTLTVPSVAAVVTDIEGTTTPISFVKATLFPYARARLREFLKNQASSPEVAGIITELASITGNQETDLDALAGALEQWMDQDLKRQPLKTLQGLIWREGYRSGELRGAIYNDVPAVLRAWHAEGFRLAVYSSGSALAQQLLFSSTPAGDLASYFDEFFDTAVGGKREVSSYHHIAAALGLDARRILFLSDTGEELDAAAAAGMRTVQIVRDTDRTAPQLRHPHVASLKELSLQLAAEIPDGSPGRHSGMHKVIDR